MQSSSNLFTSAQKQTIVDCLGKGRAERINIKIDNYGMVRLAIERTGHTSGFQRMSYKIDLNGVKSSIVQTAFDNNAKLVHQAVGASKNNLYDVKKGPVKK